jgi:hypothetical protein
MTFTYTADPTNVPIDMVRFIIGDTDANAPLLADSEIEFLIATKGSANSAAQAACVKLMAKFAREVDYTIGPESVSASQRFEQYKLLLKELKSVQAITAVPLWQEPIGGAGQPIFDIGMHDARGVNYGLTDKE